MTVNFVAYLGLAHESFSFAEQVTFTPLKLVDIPTKELLKILFEDELSKALLDIESRGDKLGKPLPRMEFAKLLKTPENN